jgi:predicted DNA-binding ribbon-helix-helix protein
VIEKDIAAQMRTVNLVNRRTTIRLESIVWAALEEIAADTKTTVHDILLSIDQTHPRPSLAAAIRVYVIGYYRRKLAERR